MKTNMSMKNLHGAVVEPNKAIVALIKETNEGKKIIGTGFYITRNGVIATAKHVLTDIIDKGTKKPKGSLFVPHFYEEERKTYTFRPIAQIILADDADVALALPVEMKHVKTGQRLESMHLVLSSKIAEVGSHLTTFAYPKSYMYGEEIHLWADYYEGKVTEYLPNGRDRTFLPTACYQTSINILAGASGGPVFSSEGQVVGINSTGFDGQSGLSFVSCISKLLGLAIPVNGCQRTIRELAEMGYVSLDKPFNVKTS